MEDGTASVAIQVQGLSFSPLPGHPHVLKDVTFELPRASRCTCVGHNGAGKSTLLQLLSGSKLAPAGQVKVLGADPFRTSTGSRVALITGGWREAAYLTFSQVYRTLGLESPEDELGSRHARLADALGLRPLLGKYHGMMSDGQHRRVELAWQLWPERDLVLLDEATSELDVLSRQALHDFLAEEGVTVVNVTHVFDGLAPWTTHVLQLEGGRLVRCEPWAGSEGMFGAVSSWLNSASLPDAAAREAFSQPREGPALHVKSLSFSYGSDSTVASRLDELELPSGCRCLLVGLNGVGKSSLLSVLGGRRLVTAGEVRVLGRRPFQDHAELDADLAVLSAEWKHHVAQLSSGKSLTFKELADTAMKELMAAGLDMSTLAARLLRLMQLLSIEPAKPIGLLSDGAMRRVQIALKLLRPAAVLLVDEVTADLDVVARRALLDFLREESAAGCAIVYCTHIMDGVDGWATHLLHMRPAGLTGQLQTLPAEVAAREGHMLETVISLLREDAALEAAAPSAARKANTTSSTGGSELPSGWEKRMATHSGAYGNHAWEEERGPEENWRFASVAPPPPDKPMAAVQTGMPGMPGAAAAAGAAGVPGMPGLPPVTDSCPWGSATRGNQMGLDELMRQGAFR